MYLVFTEMARRYGAQNRTTGKTELRTALKLVSAGRLLEGTRPDDDHGEKTVNAPLKVQRMCCGCAAEAGPCQAGGASLKSRRMRPEDSTQQDLLEEHVAIPFEEKILLPRPLSFWDYRRELWGQLFETFEK